MKTFEQLWLDLVRHLKPGLTIDNWTAFRGNLGDMMTVVGVRDEYIEIEAPNAKTIQRVPKEDFAKVWDIWFEYNSQKLQRQDVRAMTFFSKYIISILHWYEQNVMDH